MLVYDRLNVVAGEDVHLVCNTSLTNVTWTYDDDNNDGYVFYVYWNEHFDKSRFRPSQLSLQKSERGIHSLVISDAEWNDSGYYDCYDRRGSRQRGYQLVVNSMFKFITEICLALERHYSLKLGIKAAQKVNLSLNKPTTFGFSAVCFLEIALGYARCPKVS